MSYTSLQKKFLNFLLFLVFIHFLSLNSTPVEAAAAGESYGWFASKVDYVRDAVGCNVDQASIEIQLSSANSKTPVPLFFGSWNIFIRDSSGTIVRSQNFVSTVLSEHVCFNPITESIQVIVGNSSLYNEFTSPAITAGAELSLMVGYHFRGYVHLDKKSDGNSSYISGVFPNNTALNTTPAFFVQTSIDTLLYGTPSLETIKVYAVNLNTNNYTTLSAEASGGVGIRALTGMTSLPSDGNYFWVYHQNYNGTSYTEKPSSVYNWTFNSLPSSGVIRPLSFIYDTTAPNSNYFELVKAKSAPDADNVKVLVKVGMQDVTSGLGTSTVYVRTGPSNTVVAVVETPLQQQKDLMSLQLDVTLPESQSYSFLSVVSDMAGNVATSTALAFTAPTAESLAPPQLTAQSASDIRTTQITFRSQVSITGGSLVNSRGTCWQLDPTNFTSATNTANCKISFSNTTGFSTDVYSHIHTGLPASTTIYYRGFATNGSGIAFSNILSTTTLPYTDATTTNAKPPVIGTAYSASTTADSSRLGGRIDATGGALVTFRGVCWAISLATLPAEPNNSSSCYSWTNTISGKATLPQWYDRVFYNLPYNTTVYYRAYAANSAGTSSRTNSVKTLIDGIDFDVLDYTVDSTYNSTNDTYSLIIPFILRDLSTYVIGVNASNVPLLRTVSYTVKVETLAGDLIDTITGSTAVRNQYTFSLPTIVMFNDVPLGLTKVSVSVNDPVDIYPETVASSTNNIRPKILNLTDPKDIVTSGGGGSGPTLPDPGFELSLTNTTIRSGFSTNINWDTKVGYSMSCQIIGPSTFDGDGIFTFNPASDGVIGSVSTGPLTSAQIFELSCTEPVTGSVFSATTRVEVIGELKEI